MWVDFAKYCVSAKIFNKNEHFWIPLTSISHISVFIICKILYYKLYSKWCNKVGGMFDEVENTFKNSI